MIIFAFFLLILVLDLFLFSLFKVWKDSSQSKYYRYLFLAFLIPVFLANLALLYPVVWVIVFALS
ncbi:hypothetical protein J2Z52_002008 [Enterococcus rivorum]|nr:hypothetical protein [Enterococcus rivorum]